MIRVWGTAGVAALVAIVFAVAIPATASAATYCVHVSGSCLPGEIDEGSNLQAALTAANGTGADDQVKVGTGSYAGPFVYAGAGGPAQITGVGPGTILLAAPTNGVTVLNVSNARSRVENLHIDVPVGNSSMTNFGLALSGGTADRVFVQVANSPPFNVAGVNLINATFRNGSVLGPMPAMAPSSIFIDGIVGGGTNLIEDSTIHIDNAVDVSGGGSLRRLDLQARVGGQLQSETSGGGSGSYLIDDSLWQSQPGAADDFVVGLLIACGGSSNMQATVRNTTLLDNAPLGSPMTAACNAPNKTTAIDVSSTIALGGNRLVSSTGGGMATSLNLAYSDFDPAKLLTLGSGAINPGVGNVNVVPGFAGATDFHLVPGSPLIDIGDPAGLAPGESPVDFGGGARIQNGTGACSGPRRDIGAYEAAGIPVAASCTPASIIKKCKKHKKKHKRAAAGAKKKKKCKKHKKKP